MFKNVIISAPFGNYFNRDYCTSTLGTYTLHPRGGLLKRIWRTIKTVRYNKSTQSWVNKLGLPNPGLYSLYNKDYSNNIISIHGFNSTEWSILANRIITLKPLACELNLSCPNVDHEHNIEDIIYAINLLHYNNIPVIAKLPPINYIMLAQELYYNNIRIFHCCNTLPSPNGGISGKQLKPFSLICIKYLRKQYEENITIIGGGGITNINDVMDYYNIGANHIAVASMLFNPFNWSKLKDFSYVDPGYYRDT